MHKHEYQMVILNILDGDEDFLRKIFKSVAGDKIPTIENKESLRVFLIEIFLVSAKSENIEIIDNGFTNKLKYHAQKHKSLLVLIKNGLKICLDEVVEKMRWAQEDFTYIDYKDLISHLLQIQPLEVSPESMQSIIYKALENQDFDFAEQLISLSDQNDLKIIDENFVERFSRYPTNYKLLLILFKRGMKISLNRLVNGYKLEGSDYDDYKSLILYLLQGENLQINQKSLGSILTESLRKGDIGFAEELFNRIDKEQYHDILKHGTYPKLALEWFAKKLLDIGFEEEIASDLISISIRSDLWEICDLLIQKYPNIDLTSCLEYYSIDKNIIDRLLKKIDRNNHFEVARKILSKILETSRYPLEGHDKDLELVQYLLYRFPQLTINDIGEEYTRSQLKSSGQYFNDPLLKLKPDIMILLLNKSPSDSIELGLAQRIFEVTLFSSEISRLKESQKQEYLKMRKIILQKKPSLSYHDIIYDNIRGYMGNSVLEFLLAQIPQEQITEDFKANIAEMAIKSCDLYKLKIINNFLEANAVVIDYLAQLRAIISIDVKSEHYKYLFGKVSFIPKELAQELLQKIFERYSSCQENIELLELLISKTDETILDYNKLINTNHVVYRFDSLKWLLGKLKTISNQDAEKLIKSLVSVASDSDTDKDYCAIMQLIIDKTKGLELTQFLQEIRHSQLLKFFLAKIDQKITDPDLSQKLLIFAIGKKDENLFQIIEAKLAAINYSLLLNFAVNDHEVDFKMLRVLLSREVDVNLKHCGGGYRSREAVYPLEFYSQHDEAIGLLIEHGAKLSLIDSQRYGDQKYSYPQRAIIKYLCKNLNYSYLEEYLSQLLDEDIKRAAVKLIFDQALDLDNEKLLKLVIDHGFDVNSKSDNYYPLYTAISWDKLKVAEFLVKMKAFSDQNPVFNLIEKKHNRLLEILCQGGYDYNQRAEYNYFGSQKKEYPLQAAIIGKNEAAAKILLQYLTSDQVRDIERESQYSLLSTAIHYEQEEVALLILEKLGSDFEIKNEYNIFYSACEHGMLELVKKFHKARNLDVNKKEVVDHAWIAEVRSPLISAIKKGKNNVMEYLLDQLEIIVDDDVLMNAAESKDISDDLLIKIAKNTQNINCRDINNQTILHKVIKSDKKSDVIEEIIEMISDINAFDREGATAIHIAATSGNKEIFQLLINRGANPLRKDNQGNNAYYHALYNNNLDKLGISSDNFPFELSVYNELLEYIKKQPETKYLDPATLGSMAAKFACLFDNWVELESYTKKHASTGERPIHDLSIFSLPEGEWDKEAWKKLAIENGLKLTKYLFLAPIIEENLGKAPADLAEVESHAKAVKYSRADQNPEMAEIFHENMIPGYIFDMMLDSYKPKTDDHIPEILIEGDKQQQSKSLDVPEGFDHSRCYMKKLSKVDLRGFVLGNKTNCCQYVGSDGHNCAVHGMTSAYGGFYVIFKKGKKGRCDNLEKWLKNLETSMSKEEFLNRFQEKATKNKYKGIIEEIERDFEVKHGKKAGFNDIKEVLKQNFEQELEGEIIAQSWVWLSQNGNLVLDSWERLSAEYDALFKPFMKKMAEDILTKNPNIKKILMGAGGCTPRDAGLSEIKDPEKPMDYTGYRDSGSQYLIAQTLELESSPNPIIRVNAAISISNQRIQQLGDHFVYGSQNLKTLEQIQKNWRKYCQDQKLEPKKDSGQLVA